MDIKNKILSALIITVVIVAGGFSLINRISNTVDYPYEWDKESYILPFNDAVLKSIDGRSPKSPTRSYTAKNFVPSVKLPSVGFENHEGRSLTGGAGLLSDKIQHGYSYSYKTKQRENENLGGHPGLILPGLSYSVRSGVSAPAGQGSYTTGTMPSIAAAPLATPFGTSAGPPKTGGGTILFDPGVETDNIEGATIPVGEGGWILLLLGVGYFIIRKYWIK